MFLFAQPLVQLKKSKLLDKTLHANIANKSDNRSLLCDILE